MFENCKFNEEDITDITLNTKPLSNLIQKGIRILKIYHSKILRVRDF